jgi:hypothetical protein
VWVIFLIAMSGVTGLLMLQGGQARIAGGFVLTSIDTIGDRVEDSDAIFRLSQQLDRNRWTGIVIHDLGEPAGDAESVTRKHMKLGLHGLGYHFLIGNGNGLGDGVVHVGFRWDQQLPGAHALGSSGDHHNQHSISICLIGNGERRAFTDQQFTQLVRLVQQLQAKLNIPAAKVWLHRDLAPSTKSPGRYFPAARFHEQLLK